MWIVVDDFNRKINIEEFDSYEEAEEKFNKLNEYWIEGRTIYIAKVELYSEQHRGKFR